MICKQMSITDMLDSDLTFGEWICVTERQPQKSGPYLTVYRRDDPPTHDQWTKDHEQAQIDCGDHFYEMQQQFYDASLGRWLGYCANILYWMPFPEWPSLDRFENGTDYEPFRYEFLGETKGR